MADPETPEGPEVPGPSSEPAELLPIPDPDDLSDANLGDAVEAIHEAGHQYGLVDDEQPEGFSTELTNPLGCAVLLGILTIAIAIVLAAFTNTFSGLFSSDTTPVEVGGTTPYLEFPNDYNSEGQLIPIPGVWEIYNEDGVATCAGDLELEAGQRRGLLELVDPEGQQIRVKPLLGDDTSGDDSGWTTLDLISSSESEAVYEAEDVGPDGTRMTAVFSSSSTLGARLEECATRGGNGWLEEASD